MYDTSEEESANAEAVLQITSLTKHMNYKKVYSVHDKEKVINLYI